METLARWAAGAVMGFVMLAASGCVSVQFPGKDGLPRLVGFGRVTAECGDGGTVRRIESPGISLRLTRWNAGLTLGYDTTVLFVGDAPPANDGGADPGVEEPGVEVAAFYRDVRGVELGAFRLMAGHRRRFGVPVTHPEASVVQWIHFRSDGLLRETTFRRSRLP